MMEQVNVTLTETIKVMPLPWRPEEGSVVRMFCHITHQDGTPFEYDSRALLEKAIKAASEEGCLLYTSRCV